MIFQVDTTRDRIRGYSVGETYRLDAGCIIYVDRHGKIATCRNEVVAASLDEGDTRRYIGHLDSVIYSTNQSGEEVISIRVELAAGCAIQETVIRILVISRAAGLSFEEVLKGLSSYGFGRFTTGTNLERILAEVDRRLPPPEPPPPPEPVMVETNRAAARRRRLAAAMNREPAGSHWAAKPKRKRTPKPKFKPIDSNPTARRFIRDDK